jgi:predicted dehydrogenase
MTLRLGVIGYSEGNGHPLSFSAIVNGFDEEAMARAGWPVIHNYLKARGPHEFGFPDVRVEAISTPDPTMAKVFASACRIPYVVADPAEMFGLIDAVMILRDDYATHWQLARPFLNKGVPTFVDKPLCVSAEELAFFRPHLESGKLMSCSGLRFCSELDGLRADPGRVGKVKLIGATVVVDWPRYGVHMLEAAMGALHVKPVAIQRHVVGHESMAIRMEDGALMLIDALGAVPKTFSLAVFGDKAIERVEINDNFFAFRRTIGHFVEQIRSGVPALDPAETMLALRTLISGLACEPGGPEQLIA